MANFVRLGNTEREERPWGAPNCFGERWELDDHDYCGRCPFFNECGSVYEARYPQEAANQRAVSENSKHNVTPPRRYHTQPANQSYTRRVTATATTTADNRTTTTTTSVVQRRIGDYPAGTEYIDPKRAGKAGPVERFTAMAVAEGTSAFAQQVGHAIQRFFKDLANFHTAAGKWKYRENYEKPRTQGYTVRFGKKPQQSDGDEGEKE